MKTQKDWRRIITEQMEMVETYHLSFDLVIDSLAALMVDYEKSSAKFMSSGGNHIVAHTNKSGATNAMKNPYYLVIEKQRDTILKYASELGLTPSGLKRVKGDVAETSTGKGIESWLSEIEGSLLS